MEPADAAGAGCAHGQEHTASLASHAMAAKVAAAPSRKNSLLLPVAWDKAGGLPRQNLLCRCCAAHGVGSGGRTDSRRETARLTELVICASPVSVAARRTAKLHCQALERPVRHLLPRRRHACDVDAFRQRPWPRTSSHGVHAARAALLHRLRYNQTRRTNLELRRLFKKDRRQPGEVPACTIRGLVKLRSHPSWL